MKNPWIFPAAALVLGAFGGFIAGNQTSSTGTPTNDGTSAPRTRSQTRADASTSTDAKRSGSRARSTSEIFRSPGQSDRIQALMNYYAGLTPAQLEAEAAKLEDLPMAERIMASFLLFGKWAETDPTAAMAYTEKMGFTGNFIRPTVLQSWASADPAGAAKYYSENARQFTMMGMMGGGRGPMGGGGASVIASEWARQDPTAAFKWASSLSGNEKGSAMSSVIGEIASSDPKKAAGMVASMDAASQGRAYEDIARKWGAKDFTEAETWARTLPADQQEAAMASAIAGLSKDNPKLASEKIAALPEGDALNEATKTLAQNWSRENPKEAAAWVMKQGDDSAKSDAMGEVMPNWVSQDPKSALAFVNSQPAGPVRDSAASSYIMSDHKSAPAELVKVAETITDENSRNRSLGMTTMRWMQEDPDAAKGYVQSSDAFSADQKERVAAGKSLWGGGGGRRGGPPAAPAVPAAPAAPAVPAVPAAP
ncbi:MAG: hypothetical protein NTW21_23970 [Verrucomicrobia bacterium]|nr:hypothetical protein [Verrucomicrobiota bacterium]